MKIVFMGTPDFAVGIMEELYHAGHEIVLAVSQPDKPKGRGKELQPTPVKEAAEKLGIEVFQPAKIREISAAEKLWETKADIFVVAAFGQILPKEILDMPRFGCINVHASLLPKYRGAAPIQWAVINGEKESGVTIMKMDEGLDTGDMIEQVTVPLAEDETAGTLFDKLAKAGAKLCAETIRSIENGTAVYTRQNDEKATHTSMIRKQMGAIDWSRPAEEIERLIRGLSPWPSAYTRLGGKTLKIWKAAVEPEKDGFGTGEITDISSDSFGIQTGKGILRPLEVQLEGKKRMDTAAFLRGYELETGMKLGE